MYFSALLVTLFASIAVDGYPTGAPSAVCDSMMPGHGVQPQNSPFPYKIILDKSNLEGGQSIKVTIKAKDGLFFRGFLIQARAGDKTLGKFSVAKNEGKLLNCGEGEENTVTHSDPSDKKEVTVEWTAPKDFKGEIIFYVTIVQVYDTFWVKEKSEPVTIS